MLQHACCSRSCCCFCCAHTAEHCPRHTLQVTILLLRRLSLLLAWSHAMPVPPAVMLLLSKSVQCRT